MNWRTGELTIRGKGGRVDVLPLPADVGAAIAEYLLHARPTSPAWTLFVTAKAPFTGLAVSTVTVLVGAACARAGVSRWRACRRSAFVEQAPRELAANLRLIADSPFELPIPRPPAAGLTDREIEVVTLLCWGLSNAEIAQQLWLTEKTVKNHLNHIFTKLGVRSRTEAVVRWTT